MMPPPDRERGLVLINVLLMVALASGLLAAILIAENAGIARSTRIHDAATADAALAGGELSAIVALRRDLLQGTESDNPGEPWAKISTTDAKIAGGTFTLLVTDAQAKLNLNAAARNDGPTLTLLPQVIETLKLPVDTTIKIVTFFRQVGPIASIAQLGLAGLDAPTIARLATLCTVLPPSVSKINANFADERMLGILAGDPIAGRLIAGRRARKGSISVGDFIATGTRPPAIVVFTSDYYWARGRVTIGDTGREQTSLLRRSSVDMKPAVEAIGRWLGAAAPLDAPPLPTKPPAERKG